jgi:hypothetical protein
MRYLLDELMTYEEGFGDILMADRASERHETFMGDQDLSAAISRADLQQFEVNLIQKVLEVINLSPVVPSGEGENYPIKQVDIMLIICRFQPHFDYSRSTNR